METAAWIQASAAVVMMIATVVLARITWNYVNLTKQLVRSQVEPVVDFGINRDGEEIVVANIGAYQILDISVDRDTVCFLGPPWNKPIAKVRTGPKTPGRGPQAWWYLASLSPGEVKNHPIGEVVNDANNLLTTIEKQKAQGQIRDISPTDNVQLFTFVVFRLVFHRDFDRRRYTSQKVIYVVRDSSTGKPFAMDAEYHGPIMGGEMLQQLREAK